MVRIIIHILVVSIFNNVLFAIGDEFVICSHPAMLPTQTFTPANYDPAQRLLLDRPSTRADIADFVTSYLYSDVCARSISVELQGSDLVLEHRAYCIGVVG